MNPAHSLTTLYASTRAAGIGTSANRLLAATPDIERQRWVPHLKLVELTLGQVISEPGSELAYAYFPLKRDRLAATREEGWRIRGNRSGGKRCHAGRHLVHGWQLHDDQGRRAKCWPGLRQPVCKLIEAVARGGGTLLLLLLYTQSLLTQMTQTAACSRHHTLNQRFSRWLLVSFDRLCGDEMVMAQKLVANVLGVTSDEVTVSAMALGASGAIDYRDGRIGLLDRMLLEKASCECYQAELVNTMLDTAIKTVADCPNRPIVHSDRGAHYRWPGWLSRIGGAGLIRSMSRKA